MTKFILIGGYPYKAKDGGRSVCIEAIKGFSEPVSVLICLFAREKEDWPILFEKNKQFFISNLPGIKLDFVLADEENFIDQLEKTQLLYICGGDATKLLNRLRKTGEWSKKTDGKCVMGSSASTDILTTYNYDVEFFKCSDGLGLVPVKTIVHYGSEDYKPPIGWKSAYEVLKRYKEPLPIFALKEGKFKVVYC